jgi:hypothetical protein
MARGFLKVVDSSNMECMFVVLDDSEYLDQEGVN